MRGYNRKDPPNLLLHIPNEIIQDMWFMHDGAPAHYSQEVRQTLNEGYPQKWIGRGGPVNYPPRSPDLTCMDYYLWGRLKNLVYVARPTTREDMMRRIRDAVRSINGEEVLRAVDNFNVRVERCLENNGMQFEHL
uniref:Tc1-like transposase DDE domain-containing protein n=2 Tax=Graphocephala atropunctata TaxID=36148 RepID=A0A1B6KGF3_9HEMI